MLIEDDLVGEGTLTEKDEQKIIKWYQWYKQHQEGGGGSRE